MPLTVAQTVRVSAEFTAGGQIMANVHHFMLMTPDPVNDPDVLSDMAEIMNTAYSLVNNAISNVVNYTQIRAQLAGSNYLFGTANWPSLVSGGAAGEALPYQVTALIWWPTQFSRTQARCYLPPASEAANTGAGLIGAAEKALMLSFGAYLADPITIGVNQYQKVTFNTTTFGTAETITSRVADRFRTQRRRRIGVGV